MMDQRGSWRAKGMMTARLPSNGALLVLAAASAIPVASAQAASAPVPDCSMSATLANWGENSTGDIDIVSGASCQFTVTMHGTVTGADISQKPSHGKLKKIDLTRFEYRTKAKYKGSDSFAIKVTGQGATAPGTSVITVNATIK